MDEEQRQFIQGFLVNLCRSLGLFSVEQLETVKNESTNITHLHTVMPMLDPTEYRKISYDGTIDSMEVQSETLTHFIEIRKLIDRQEGIRQEYLKRIASKNEHLHGAMRFLGLDEDEYPESGEE
jgi:hypothetical protein